MKANSFLHRPLAAPEKGFSLIELLVVISIAALLGVLALHMYAGATRGGRLNYGVRTLCGSLEVARQQAVARNTYTWVLFSSTGTGAGETAIVAMVASANGTDSLSWTTSKIRIPGTGEVGANLELMEKTLSLPTLRIANGDAATVPGLPAQPVDPADPAEVDIDLEVGGKTLTFTRAIQFTPTGEARVNDALVSHIDLAVLLQLADNPDMHNQAVLRVAGLTGKSHVYRN